MEIVFYISAGVAIAATIMMLTRLNAVHALLYLVVSLLALAILFYILGAPFAAALEVIIYAGAIMVLFVFVVMLLNLGQAAIRTERTLVHSTSWIGPSILSAILAAEFVYLLSQSAAKAPAAQVGPAAVGFALFGPYMLGLELASMLLLAGVIGAHHLGRRRRPKPEAG